MDAPRTLALDGRVVVEPRPGEWALSGAVRQGETPAGGVACWFEPVTAAWARRPTPTDELQAVGG